MKTIPLTLVKITARYAVYNATDGTILYRPRVELPKPPPKTLTGTVDQ